MGRKQKMRSMSCEICGNSTAHLKYFGRNIYPRTCSIECKGKLISKTRTREINGIKASILTAQKVAENRKKNGSYISGAEKMKITKTKNNSWQTGAEKRLKSMIFDDDFKNKIKTGMSKIGDDGLTAAQRGAQHAIKTKILNGQICDPSKLPEFIQYRRNVMKVTRQQPLHLLPNIEKRGHVSKNGWHLDHKISIFEGYNAGIDFRVIGHIDNLQMIPALDNIKKGTKSK
jgi:hypothetical protein